LGENYVKNHAEGAKRTAMTEAPPKNGWLRLEWVSAILISLVALALHVVFLNHAGGFWRDETCVVQIGTLPTLGDVWEMLPHDHCPILVPALVRLWTKLGLGNTDFGIRQLGFILGLMLTASYWASARIMRRGLPLVALSLVGVNVMVIRTGDSLRAYGLGSTLSVLSLALIWRAAKNPRPANLLWAAVVAVISVQCLYQNAVFIFAGCCGGFVVCLMERRWRDIVRILGIGFVAAISLLPYVAPIRASQDWWILARTGFTMEMGLRNLSTLMGFPSPIFAGLWIVLGLFALYVAVLAVKEPALIGARDLILFNTVAMVVGMAGFFAFLKSSNLPTQFWYFIPLLVFITPCLEAILLNFRSWMSPAAASFAVLMAIAACLAGIPQAKCRQTNMDLLAARLMKVASAEDYIVVQPWYYGVSFNRYYHGNTPWATLPQLANYEFHRYDQLKVRMQEEHPIQPVIDQMLKTLQNGHRVWVVGGLDVSAKPPPEMNPAPNNPWGWADSPYAHVWGMQAGYAIATHALKAGVPPKVTEDCISPFEDVPVLIFAGWRPGATAP